MNDKSRILSLYLVLLAVLVFRIVVHEDHYTTPDSIAYLEAAQQLQGWSMTGTSQKAEQEIKEIFILWPVGYPASIALVSALTTLPVLVSSKIVNFIFLGLIFFLLYRWFGKNAWFITLGFFAYGSLEIMSHTWSEGPFLFLVLLLTYIISKDLKREKTSSFLFLKLTLTLFFLFLFRYVGVIYSLFAFLVSVKIFLEGNKIKALHYWIALFFSGLMASTYLLYLKLISGHHIFEERFFPFSEQPSDFFKNLMIGLLNECSLARNYFFKGPPDMLYIFLTLLQVGVVIILFRHRKYLSRPVLGDWDTKLLVLMGGFYLISIVILRSVSPFDSFDYRLLAPFSFPVMTGLLAAVSLPRQQPFFKKCSPWIVAFFILSLLVNLPKKYILQSIKKVDSTVTHIVKWYDE